MQIACCGVEKTLSRVSQTTALAAKGGATTRYGTGASKTSLCAECGVMRDRGVNAAKSILALGHDRLAVGIHAL